MATVLTVDSGDINYLQVQTVVGQQGGSATTSYVKSMTGNATLPGGEIVDFTLAITKINSAPSQDIVDPDGEYTITIDKA